MSIARKMMSKMAVAFALVLVLSLSILPMTAFATDDTAIEPISASVTDANEANNDIIPIDESTGKTVESDLVREGQDAETAIADEAATVKQDITPIASDLEEHVEKFDWSDYWWVLLLPLLGLLAWFLLRRKPEAHVEEIVRPVAVEDTISVEDEIVDERYV